MKVKPLDGYCRIVPDVELAVVVVVVVVGAEVGGGVVVVTGARVDVEDFVVVVEALAVVEEVW